MRELHITQQQHYRQEISYRGFHTKKKPMSQSERKAKSRANQSDEKKKEDNKKMLAYNLGKA